MASKICQRAPVNASPASPTAWRWSQQWRDVLFLHWPVEATLLRERLPAGLAVDTYGGQAWISLVGFRLQAARFCGWPRLPFCCDMLELNYRTYVRYRGEEAIYFLSMHANHRALIAAARCLTPLPYEFANLVYGSSDGLIDFHCQESCHERPLLSARFCIGPPIGPAEADSLDAWLTERYVAYAGDRRGLLRMEAVHPPWPLREIVLQQWQQRLPVTGKPVCHYSDGVSALLSTFQSV